MNITKQMENINEQRKKLNLKTSTFLFKVWNLIKGLNG